jgi:hypothetical protein
MQIFRNLSVLWQFVKIRSVFKGQYTIKKHSCLVLRSLSDGNRKRRTLFSNTLEYKAPLHPYVAAPIFSLLPTPVLSYGIIGALLMTKKFCIRNLPYM